MHVHQGSSVRRLTPIECEPPDGLAGRLDDRGGVDREEWFRNSQSDRIFHPDRIATAMDGTHGRPGFIGAAGGSGMTDDPLLPLGLDSHRYRCCGNGVVADVGEWIGSRLLDLLDSVA